MPAGPVQCSRATQSAPNALRGSAWGHAGAFHNLRSRPRTPPLPPPKRDQRSRGRRAGGTGTRRDRIGSNTVLRRNTPLPHRAPAPPAQGPSPPAGDWAHRVWPGAAADARPAPSTQRPSSLRHKCSTGPGGRHTSEFQSETSNPKHHPNPCERGFGTVAIPSGPSNAGHLAYPALPVKCEPFNPRCCSEGGFQHVTFT